MRSWEVRGGWRTNFKLSQRNKPTEEDKPWMTMACWELRGDTTEAPGRRPNCPISFPFSWRHRSGTSQSLIPHISGQSSQFPSHMKTTITTIIIIIRFFALGHLRRAILASKGNANFLFVMLPMNSIYIQVTCGKRAFLYFRSSEARWRWAGGGNNGNVS